MAPAPALAVAMLILEMLRRGVDSTWLAKQIGLTPHGMANALRLGVPNCRTRWKIEAALGLSVPLWSSSNEIEMRRRCITNFSQDPRLMDLDQLIVFCRKLGVQPPGERLLESWFGNLCAWLAVHPEPKFKP